VAVVETPGDPAATIPTPLVGLAVAAMGLVFATLLFVPARRLDWTLGWIYVGIMLIYAGVNWACLARWNPELIARRMRFGKGTKTWDKVWAVLYAPVMVALYVVAGLQARDGAVSPPGPAWLLGLAMFLPGAAMLTWSMVVNPFFEKTVRIQTDRGHRVIDTGPYAYVRHPGYLGFVGWILSAPLLLASTWAVAPAVLAVAGLVIRTALEDRTLQNELTGYPEYAARVRYRLVPGIW
jgi:protein-S-isoprenylcysteine O-methyltransferase Ste14